VGDDKEKLPLSEVILLADGNEVHQAIPMLQTTKEIFCLIIEIVSGNTICDTERILHLIIEISKAKQSFPLISEASKQSPALPPVMTAMWLPPWPAKGKMMPEKNVVLCLQGCCSIRFGKEK
jgi:hypothetical protein